MRFPAQLPWLRDMLLAIRTEAVKAGFEGEKVRQIELAAEEALVNIIRYAYPNQLSGDVEILCLTESDHSFTVKISDHGRPFNPMANPEPELDAPLENRPVGGLGVFLMQQCVDHVAYQREQGANILVLTKKRR